jgi:hypothetical protein
MAHLRRPGIDASLATTQGKKKSRKSRGKPIQELGITDWLRSRRIWCRKWRARGAGAFVVAIGGKRGRRGLLNRRQYCCGRDDGTPQLGHIFAAVWILYTQRSFWAYFFGPGGGWAFSLVDFVETQLWIFQAYFYKNVWLFWSLVTRDYKFLGIHVSDRWN